MLYLLHGNNEKARVKAHDVVTGLKKKKPGASYFSFNSLTWNESEFIDLVQGIGLFEQKYIIFLDSIFENKEAKEFFLKALKEIAAVEHIVVILEKELDKKSLDKIEKNAFKVENFTEAKEKKGGFGDSKKFNAFDLADALGRKDKKSLWVLYQKALQHEAVCEELHGILWWQVKAMILAKEAKNAGEADLNPYVFTKAKGFAGGWNAEELSHTASSLVSLYHDSHRGEGEFEIGLEKFILSLQ